MWRVTVVAVVVLLLSGADSVGISEAEFSCEEAVAHLADCCVLFDTSAFRCVEDGCNGVHAELGIDQSRCIVGAPCRALREGGACEDPRKVMCP